MRTFACSILGLFFALQVQAVAVLQQPPTLISRAPDYATTHMHEGETLDFRVQFSDETDPDSARRGMSNVVWLVDGVPVLEAADGAPRPITSDFLLHADYTMVTNGAYRDFEIRAVGSDIQGGATEAVWGLRVFNVAQRQTITLGRLPEKTLGDADFSPGATASSGLPVSYTSSNPDVAQIVDGMIRLVGAGVTLIEACQTGNSDYLAARPVSVWLTVRARLSADVFGGGTVTGTGCYMPETEVVLEAVPAGGFYFQRWENGSHALSRRLVMPATNVQVSATFSTDMPAPELGALVPPRGMVGVGFTAAIPILSDCRPSVQVSGLPQGLAYNSAARAIEGVPRAACSNRLVTVTVTNPLGVSVSRSFSLTVDPLPAWGKGAFAGYMEAFAGHTGGLASMQVSESGQVRGKFVFGDATLTFAADSLAFCEGWDDYYISGPFYWLWLPLKDGATEWFLELTIEQRDVSPWLGATCPPVGYVRAHVLRNNGDGTVTPVGLCEMCQSVKESNPAAALLGQRYAGYYTATLDGCAEYGSGYLTLTVDKRGGVKAAGKLADGTAVALSGQLVLDGNGRVWSTLFVAPANYKSGAFFGVVEWVKPEDGPAFLQMLYRPATWTSRNPLATAEYGAGFSRQMGLTGGWYDKVGNLYDYYRGRTLSFAADSEASNPVAQIGETACEAVLWRPDGLAISPVLSRSGWMAGLAAPKPTSLLTPGDPLGGNPIQLAVALNRATGIFSGTFNAWFDLCPDDEAEYFRKRVSFVGVLTPERVDKTDGCEGRGYFLWSAQGQRMGDSAWPSTYLASESYDLRLLSQPAN